MNEMEVVPNPLLPDGIEGLKLRCVICTKEVPARRATSRSKDTCGPECGQVLRDWKKYNILRRRCRTCYHPSSPKEREEFKLWRKSRGEVGEAHAGRMSDKDRGRRREYSEALKQAIALLTGLTDGSVDEGDFDKYVDAVQRFQDLLDGKAWVRRPLPVRGDAAEISGGEDNGLPVGQAVRTKLAVAERTECDSIEPAGDADGAAARDFDAGEQHGDAGAEREPGDGAAVLRAGTGYAGGADPI